MKDHRRLVGARSEIGSSRSRLVTGEPERPKTPCDVCKRCHRGRRCLPEEDLKRTLTITIAPRLLEAMEDAGIFWGDRSGYVARLIEEDLL